MGTLNRQSEWGWGKGVICLFQFHAFVAMFVCLLASFFCGGGGGGGGMYCNVMLRTAMSRNCNAVQVNAITSKEENKCLLRSTFVGFTLFFSSPPEAHVYFDTLLAPTLAETNDWNASQCGRNSHARQFQPRASYASIPGFDGRLCHLHNCIGKLWRWRGFMA